MIVRTNPLRNFEDAEKHTRLVVKNTPDAIVFYGSRVSGNARRFSDWDVVSFYHSDSPPILKRRTTTRGLDLLETDWRCTKEERWSRRELCALLMDDTTSLWLDPSKKPKWEVDWQKIAEAKAERVARMARSYDRLILEGHDGNRVIRFQLLLKLRRFAQRAIYLQTERRIPSSGEVEARWSAMSTSERKKFLFPVVSARWAWTLSET